MACLELALLAGACRAGQWPQILGPHRNGHADGERIAAQWPADGPPLVWQRKVGSGFAGVAVAGGELFVYHRQGTREIIECLAAMSGEPVWSREFPTEHVASIVEDDGPRCVPLVDGERIYLLGAGGDLRCVSRRGGEPIWHRSARREFAAPEGYFGFGSTPILAGERLFANLGGRDGHGIVCFSAATGETLWRATNEAASYSSPVAATLNGRPQIVFVTRLSCLGLDPQTGQVHFQLPFGRRGPTVNAANPLLVDGNIFITASYSVGAKLLRAGPQSAEVLWENDTSLSSHYVTPIVHEGAIYGLDGRQDVGVARFRSIESSTGRVLWSEENYGMASLILADHKLIAVLTDGQLALVQPDKRAYRELARCRVFSGTTRALPALAEGLLYVRDSDTLKCLDLRRKPG